MEAAYEVVITTAFSIDQGIPLKVTGITNLPPGITIDMVLSREKNTAREAEPSH